MLHRSQCHTATTLIALAFSLAHAASADAQNLLEDLRDAVPVNRYLYITLPSGKGPFHHTEDERAELERSRPFGKKTVFIARSQGSLNVMIGFLNPLKFTWTSTESTSDDPSYAALSRFSDSTAALIALLAGSASGGASALPMPAKNKEATIAQLQAAKSGKERTMALEGFAVDPAANPLVLLETFAPDLVEWRLSITTNESVACLASSHSASQALFTAVVLADGHVYTGDKKDTSRVAVKYVATVGSIQKAILVPESLPDMRKALAQSLTLGNGLTILDVASVNALNRSTALADSVTRSWTGAYCAEYARYTKAVIARFVATAAGLVSKRQETSGELRKMLNKLDTLVVTSASSSTFGAFKIASLNVPAGKVKDVVLIVKSRSVDTTGGRFAFKETRADTVEFRVRRYQRTIAEMAPGVAYLAKVAYPRFGTDTAGGKTVVASGGEDTQRLSTLTMLNVIFSRSLSDGLYSGLQLGVGVGRNYPLLMGGGLVRFVGARNLSLSFGAAFPWYQELTKLKLGSPVSGTAQIEADLRFQLGRPSLYVGFQLGK